MTTRSPTYPSHGPPIHPFSSIGGRHSCSFFEIRPDNEVLTIRDDDQEYRGPLLRGVVVLCLQSPLRIEDAHLQLVGIMRHLSVDTRFLNQREKILEHRWKPFVGIPGKTMFLSSGNYEWPFEFTLPSNTIETVEGIQELSVTYALKATINRGKLAHDLHAYKHLRIIHTPSLDALELTQPVGVDDIWSNKIEYSIVIPQKSVAFGSSIPIKMRFTPLLKGLELRSIRARLIEVRESHFPNSIHTSGKKHRIERVSSKWDIQVTREDFWQDMIEESGQEGWVIRKTLDLPRELCDCIQDLSLENIKVRHKISLSVELGNPDGHISELLATLPVSVTLYPSIAFDRHGSMTESPTRISYDGVPGEAILPSYEDHVRDELYDSPPSRTSLEHQSNSNAAALANTESIERLDFANVSFSNLDIGDEGSDHHSHSSEDEFSIFRDLEKVPSYQTAVRTPFRSFAQSHSIALPNYQASEDNSSHG